MFKFSLNHGNKSCSLVTIKKPSIQRVTLWGLVNFQVTSRKSHWTPSALCSLSLQIDKNRNVGIFRFWMGFSKSVGFHGNILIIGKFGPYLQLNSPKLCRFTMETCSATEVHSSLTLLLLVTEHWVVMLTRLLTWELGKPPHKEVTNNLAIHCNNRFKWRWRQSTSFTSNYTGINCDWWHLINQLHWRLFVCTLNFSQSQQNYHPQCRHLMNISWISWTHYVLFHITYLLHSLILQTY